MNGYDISKWIDAPEDLFKFFLFQYFQRIKVKNVKYGKNKNFEHLSRAAIPELYATVKLNVRQKQLGNFC